MKLKTVHTYQPVRFNMKDENHFDVRIPRYEGIQMEYDEKLLIVKIEIPGKDSVLVFPTNIAFAVVADEPKKSKA